MTTQADSKQYTESQYRRLYKTLLNDHHNLRTKYVQAVNENKLLNYDTFFKDERIGKKTYDEYHNLYRNNMMIL
jgi:hypothetical protein